MRNVRPTQACNSYREVFHYPVYINTHTQSHGEYVFEGGKEKTKSISIHVYKIQNNLDIILELDIDLSEYLLVEL